MEHITDPEAECRVLSSILHSETACIEAFSIIADDDFYRPVHRDIFLLAKSLYSREVIPTYVEVLKEGMTLGFLADRKTREDLSHIAEQYIDDRNIKYWLNRVQNASKGRKAQRLLLKYRDEVQQNAVDIPDLIQRAGSDFMALAMDSDTEKIKGAGEIADQGLSLITENVEKWRQLQADYKFTDMVPLEGVPTGLSRLDSLTLGYKPGDLIILGAQTGHGKTAFALNTAMAACVDAKKPILYVNTEMSEKQIAYRWGAILSQVQLQRIRTGSITDTELSQIVTSFKTFSESGFYTSYMLLILKLIQPEFSN